MSKSEDSWFGWIVGVAIVTLIIFSVFSSSNTDSKYDQEQKEEYITEITNDIDNRYSELYDVATDMINAIDTQCVWQSDNLSEEVGDYCANALENYRSINSAGWTATSSTYNEEDSLEEIITDIVDEANSQYNELLENAREAADSMGAQCEWLVDNISSDTADYCYETINEFNNTSLNSDPFSMSEYSKYYKED